MKIRLRKGNRMKRALLVLIIAVMCLYLCSCTNSSDDSNNDVSDRSITSNDNEPVSGPQLFEVTVSAENTTTNGKTIFEITSNLPDGTELLLTLENAAGFRAQDKITLQNGQGKSSTFSAQGNSLSGTYTLRVTMGMPSLQDQSVQDVIGSNGEYMTGNIVKESGMAGSTYNSIEAEFSFDIGSSDYQEALQKIVIGQYSQAKTILEEMGENGYLISDELISNMEQLEVLLENEWVNSEYGWNNYSSFEVSVSGEEIALYNYEREYDGTKYLGEYKDRIDLEKLLKNGEVKVYCNLRDDFTLDIHDILDGEIVRRTEWVDVVYKINQ